ncbi:MAG: co-chaperone GroES [Candidatus Kerfeldbacteria bacterium]|nr:co-chaperone GroES [Candidatus Kerfeldbacteria bacterium]
MKLVPLSNRVVVKPLKEDEITKSGIVLPDSAKDEKPEKGEVIAVGSDRILENGQRVPVEVKVGDHVIFTKYGPDEIKIDNEDYLIVKHEDILAILQK